MTHQIFKSHIENSKKVFESLSKEEIQKLNDKSQRCVEDSHRRFKDGYENGMCYLCGAPLKTFSAKRICLHWMLRPKGVKKKHFYELYKTIGYFQMEAYARWVANVESPLVNINDLEVERRNKKIFETTIKCTSILSGLSHAPHQI